MERRAAGRLPHADLPCHEDALQPAGGCWPGLQAMWVGNRRATKGRTRREVTGLRRAGLVAAT